jgi:MATE family multidrug resistance protein
VLRAGADDTRGELRQIASLGAPLIASMIGTQLLVLFDFAMLGRYSTASLAGAGIGDWILWTVTCGAMGCVMGMDAPVAQAVGAGEHATARQALRVGVHIALVLAVPCTVLGYAVAVMLPSLGVEHATAVEAQRFVLGRAAFAVPFLVFTAQRSYLQAHGATRAVLIATLVSIPVHVASDVLFIFGAPSLGIPALGVVGCGIAATLSTGTSCSILALAIRGTTGGDVRPGSSPALVRTIVQQGLPAGGGAIAETAVLAAVSVLAGVFGETASAATNVVLTLFGLTHTIGLGIADACTVRAGLHVGAGRASGVRSVGQWGLALALTAISVVALAYLVIPGPLAGLFSDDAAVIAAARPALAITAAVQLAAAAMIVLVGALRGAGDTRVPFFLQLAVRYALALPAGAVLAFSMELGISGLWIGIAIGEIVAALAIGWRFARVSARPIMRL